MVVTMSPAASRRLGSVSILPVVVTVIAASACGQTRCEPLVLAAPPSAPVQTLELRAYAESDATCSGGDLVTKAAPRSTSLSAATDGVRLDVPEGRWVVSLSALSAADVVLARACQVVEVSRLSTTCITTALVPLGAPDAGAPGDGGSLQCPPPQTPSLHDACDGVSYLDCSDPKTAVNLVRAQRACEAYRSSLGLTGVCEAKDGCPVGGQAVCVDRPTGVGGRYCWAYQGPGAGQRFIRDGGDCTADCTWN